MRKNRRIDALLALIFFIVSLVPRAVYPVSRPAQWYRRSVYFIDDISRAAWQDTAYSEHPGVTTMWLSGIALRLAGVVPEQRPDGPYVDPSSLTARESAIGVFPLAVVIAAAISLMYELLRRLFSRLAASSAALLVALDPFFVGNSKVLHVDALLTALMVTSALAMLVYLRRRQDRWAVLSGALAGLALLTKGPAVFLLPYTALCLGLGVLFDREIDWRRGARAGAAWLAVVCLVYVVLFPAMWVDPLETLRFVYIRTIVHTSRAHPHPIYFLGDATSVDPGLAYYPVVWACKLTAVAAVLALVAVLYAVFDRGCSRGKRASIALLLAFALFFTLQMTLASKKMPRYLLPAFPAIDILAGVGLAWWAGRVIARVSAPRKAVPGLVMLVVLVQGAVTLAYHPYYGTHFNSLVGVRAGIWAVSTQWQGEGLDIAARALNSLPDAPETSVGSHMPTLFRQYFVGQTVQVDEAAGWYVFGVNNAMRNEGAEEGAPWDFYRRREPVTTVSFGSTVYAWVYPAADGPQSVSAHGFGPAIRLVGYDIEAPPYHPGQTLRMLLYWQSQDPLDEDYTVFVHVLDGAGQLVAQQDNQPALGARPTSGWSPGETVLDPYDLDLPRDLAPGQLTVTVGLYRWPEGTRLPAYSAEGERLSEDRVPLTVVPVTAPPREPGVWLARTMALIVLASALVALRKPER